MHNTSARLGCQNHSQTGGFYSAELLKNPPPSGRPKSYVNARGSSDDPTKTLPNCSPQQRVSPSAPTNPPDYPTSKTHRKAPKPTLRVTPRMPWPAFLLHFCKRDPACQTSKQCSTEISPNCTTFRSLFPSLPFPSLPFSSLPFQLRRA